MSDAERARAFDEAKAQKLYFELTAATIREPYHDAVADIKLIAAAFAAIRQEERERAAKVAEIDNEYPLSTRAAIGREIAARIREATP